MADSQAEREERIFEELQDYLANTARKIFGHGLLNSL